MTDALGNALGDLLDGDLHLVVGVDRAEHGAVRAFAEQDAVATVVQLVLVLQNTNTQPALYSSSYREVDG